MKEQKKLNKEKIKQYKRQLKSEQFDVENEIRFNDNGEAIIECKIGNEKDIFSPFDILKDRTIEDDFDKYLMEETEIIPLRYNLELKIHVKEDCSTDTQSQIKSAIKRFYSFKLTTSKVSLKKNKSFAFFLYAIGALSLFAMPFASKLPFIPLYESLIILIWFTLWEANDIILFKTSRQKTEQLNMLRLYNATITFVKDSKILPNTTIIADEATIIANKSTTIKND
ncbi:MAG: hypothetical protein ACI4TZ_04060 [Christensenellales bacterium]